MIFNSCPKINDGIIDIKDIKTLESNIDCFNKSFNKFEIHVEPSNIKIECHGVFKKLNHIEYKSPKFNWL